MYNNKKNGYFCFVLCKSLILKKKKRRFFGVFKWYIVNGEMMESAFYIQVKYANLVFRKFQRASYKGSNVWNFRCPYCGDSKKNKLKARGFIYKNSNSNLYFECKNCQEHKNFSTFLKEQDSNLFREFVLESFSDSRGNRTSNAPNKLVIKEMEYEWKEGLTLLSDLSKIHPAKKYAASRNLEQFFDSIFYCSNFGEYMRKLSGEELPEDPRLLFIETNRFGVAKNIIAREIGSASLLRYLTIKLDENYPKCYGFSKVDLTKQIYIVEGAIDSLCVPNTIATLDSNLTSYRKFLDKKPILVWDNEPRNKFTVSKMETALLQGENVVIFPECITQKDLNEMRVDGIDVQGLINTNIERGLSGLLKLTRWRKT